MNNPFARAQTLGQWLRSSICWAVVGGSSWWGLTTSFLTKCKGNNEFLISILLAVTAQVMLWWLAVGTGRSLLVRRPDSWLEIASWVWYVLLHLALLLALGLTLLYGRLIMAFSVPKALVVPCGYLHHHHPNFYYKNAFFEGHKSFWPHLWIMTWPR